ncbi:hypothetical protein PHYSODRAFT_299810 [Phytophthora sojae]|uniref:RxLR effector protein n=1 Tax=Phytophthora sojae (strain P6497) TaxID=1094619 RepID=G4Z9I3_PHYSP|nr:hypothetical protein PHYSODRAFT_299810 [Phytophthora sojae]EGZ22615.1 hypothetical protein PHYSODRAFT_299810 [Phytophthora sojae]|eukprot:XP_009525332.1 hypothetical protein PHYSODRAFT_299810 [Phytophthora sojae]
MTRNAVLLFLLVVCVGLHVGLVRAENAVEATVLIGNGGNANRNLQDSGLTAERDTAADNYDTAGMKRASFSAGLSKIKSFLRLGSSKVSTLQKDATVLKQVASLKKVPKVISSRSWKAAPKLNLAQPCRERGPLFILHTVVAVHSFVVQICAALEVSVHVAAVRS